MPSKAQKICSVREKGGKKEGRGKRGERETKKEGSGGERVREKKKEREWRGGRKRGSLAYVDVL